MVGSFEILDMNWSLMAWSSPFLLDNAQQKQSRANSEGTHDEGATFWRFRRRGVCSLSSNGHSLAWPLDHSHIEAFAHALQLDESYFDNHGYAASPHVPGSPIVQHGPRIRKISALSDFAPVNLKVTRHVFLLLYVTVSLNRKITRHNKKLKHRRNDYLFILLRWPLLVRVLSDN